jgi:hypothetical protein
MSASSMSLVVLWVCIWQRAYRLAWRHIGEHYASECNWFFFLMFLYVIGSFGRFVKAEADTYIAIDNLRYQFVLRSPSSELLFGALLRIMMFIQRRS